MEGFANIVVSSSVAHSIFRLNFIVRFEKDVCEAGDNVISAIVILFFLYLRNFWRALYSCAILGEQSLCLVLVKMFFLFQFTGANHVRFSLLLCTFCFIRANKVLFMLSDLIFSPLSATHLTIFKDPLLGQRQFLEDENLFKKMKSIIHFMSKTLFVPDFLVM